MYKYLDEEDKVTLFAPTDEAFDNYPKYDDLAMNDLLKYHIIPNKSISVEKLKCEKDYEMLNTEDTTTTCNKKKKDVKYQVVGGNKKKKLPKIVKPKDQMARNGYIHAIDNLILPEVTESPTDSPSESPSNSPTE